jgi:hypothetical protein
MTIDGRAVNDLLRKAHADQSALADLARRAVRAAAPTPPPPVVGLAARGRAGPGGLTGWHRTGGSRFVAWVTDAGGTGTTAGGLLALLVKSLIVPTEFAQGWRMVPPAEVLGRVNAGLLGLRDDPPVLVGLGYLAFDAITGEVVVSRGGVPPAVCLRAGGGVEVWHGPGPFLGAFPAEFSDTTGTLQPGDRLLLATVGPVERLAELADKHRHLPPDGLAYTVAGELEAEPGGCAAVVVGPPPVPSPLAGEG